MGPRPEGRRFVRGALFLAFLPLLLGGWWVGGRHTPAGALVSNSQIPYWVFYDKGGWAASGRIEALDDLGARVRTRSELLQAVSVGIPRDRVQELLGLPGVVGVKPVRRLPVSSEQSLQVPDSVYGVLEGALEALGIPQAHALGFQGTGIRIGILDGTFFDGHVTLRAKPPLATMDFVDSDPSVYPDPNDPPGAASHGTALWSLISGDSPGLLRGSAREVDVLLARVRGFGNLSQVDEDRWVEGLEWLESQGARIVVSGIGFRDLLDTSYGLEDLDGNGTPATRAADRAAQRGVLVVAPVGNGGPGLGTLEAPADGDSVLAAGAVDARGRPAAFSASGPTGDGREKPDFFAPGLSIQAASSVGNQALEPVSGTEFSGALLAGALALVVEAYPDRGPMEIMEILARSVPEASAGLEGVPNAASAIIFPEGLLPLPLQEVDGEGEVTDLAPRFQWTVPSIYPLGLPVTFHLEISEDSLFQTVLLSDSVVGTFARRPSRPLAPRARLFWRVRGRSVQGVERVTQSMGPIRVPSWVTLEVLNEPSGSEITDPQPEFNWSSPELSPPAGPFTYELQVISDREADIIQSHPGLEEGSFHLPTELPFNLPMRWRVIAQSRSGVADTVTSAGPFVVTSGANPPATILYQNFPNPFPNREFGGDGTRFWFDLAIHSTVELALFDIRGRLVKQLIPARGCAPVELDPGLYGREGEGRNDPCTQFSWDGSYDGGRRAERGVYLLRLKAGGVVGVRRVVFWP